MKTRHGRQIQTPTYLPTCLPNKLGSQDVYFVLAKPNNASIRRSLVEYCDHEGEVVSAL